MDKDTNGTRKRPTKGNFPEPNTVKRKRPDINIKSSYSLLNYEPVANFFKDLKKAKAKEKDEVEKLLIKLRHKVKMEEIMAFEKYGDQLTDDMLWMLDSQIVKKQLANTVEFMQRAKEEYEELLKRQVAKLPEWEQNRGDMKPVIKLVDSYVRRSHEPPIVSKKIALLRQLPKAKVKVKITSDKKKDKATSSKEEYKLVNRNYLLFIADFDSMKKELDKAKTTIKMAFRELVHDGFYKFLGMTAEKRKGGKGIYGVGYYYAYKDKITGKEGFRLVYFLTKESWEKHIKELES